MIRNRPIILVPVVLAALLVAAVCWEIVNQQTCAEFGPERLVYMQKAGDGYVPVYRSVCLRRVVSQ